LADNDLNSQALFPSKESTDDHHSGNVLCNTKGRAKGDLDVKFDIRMCRRTFGQRYLDNNVDIESVSVQVGHAITKTMEELYSRKRLDKATTTRRTLGCPRVDMDKARFELATSALRRQRSTGLIYLPK